MNSILSQSIVIVGAGHSSARAAHALRRAGHIGAITLIGQEVHLPYDRPPLSKAILSGSQELADCTLYDHDFYRENQIELKLGSRITMVDTARRLVTDAVGDQTAYDSLILATGAEPRRLSVPGAELPGLHYLRTADDAARLRAAFEARPKHVVIVGAGFIGLEVAAVANQMNCAVTVVEMASRVLTRAVPAQLADAVSREHMRRGVVFRMGAGVSEVFGKDFVTGLLLTDGSQLSCDCVIAGIGVVPSIHLARMAGLDVGDGIHVDNGQRTSVPNVYAIGDNCAAPSRLAGKRVRLESWKNAEEQAINVAASITGSQAPNVALPWFWSDQYDLTLQVTGLPSLGCEVVRRDLGGGAQLYLSLDERDVPVGAGALGPLKVISREMRAAQMLIDRNMPASGVHDSSRSLRALVAN